MRIFLQRPGEAARQPRACRLWAMLPGEKERRKPSTFMV